MNIISQILENDNTKKFSINNFFKENKIRSILNECNFKKEKGIPVLQVFKLVFVLVFANKNLFRILDSSKNFISFKKDVVYRFLNSVHFNWLKFLKILSTNVIKNKISTLTDEERINVLIVDDTTYNKNRSKSIELLSRVKDHTTQKWVKGFKMLTLGWSDGNTFIPILFNMIASSDSKKQLSPMKDDLDKRTNGYKFRLKALQKKTTAMVQMIKEALETGISASYVLFDSWYTFPTIVAQIKALGINTISMVKKMPKVYYNYKGNLMSIERIYASLKKKRGKAKILTSAIVSIKNEKKEDILLKIVFVRNKNKSRDWLALLTTDFNLTDEEIVRIYGKRWDIEVFFKICKSNLNLVKEFQGRSFDLLISHSTIVFTRYIMLALENRNNIDSKTIGGLFFAICDELQDIQFQESVKILLDILISAIRDILLATKTQIQAIIDYFFNNIPKYFKGLANLPCCES